MTLSEAVPARIRRAVIERDQHCCRICGVWVDAPALHHIVFRSHGGPDTLENLVVVGWLSRHDCHLNVAHGPEARLFRPLLLTCAVTPGVTALQLRRWASATST